MLTNDNINFRPAEGRADEDAAELLRHFRVVHVPALLRHGVDVVGPLQTDIRACLLPQHTFIAAGFDNRKREEVLQEDQFTGRQGVMADSKDDGKL